MVERFPCTIGHLGEDLGATTDTKYEFVDRGMATARKGFPIAVFKDNMKPCSLVARRLSGGLVILCLPGEPLLDI